MDVRLGTNYGLKGDIVSGIDFNMALASRA